MTATLSNFRATAPAPGPPQPYRFPRVARETLPNGLRVLVAENHNAPLAALRALVRSGAGYDTAETAGLALLTAELLDEGAGSRDGIQIAEDLGLLGGAIATGADWDATYVSVDLLSRNLRPAMPIFADVTYRPTFPAGELERVRVERINDILQQRDEPSAVASIRFAHLLYGDGVYGSPTLGTAESVSRITADDVHRFFRMHVIPNNSSVIVTGDIEAGAVFDEVRRAFAAWTPGPAPAPPSISPRPIDACRIYLIDKPGAVQSELRVGHLGVPRACEDYFALSIMNGLLGGIFNSRINLNLRERHRYTYGARSQFGYRRQAGPFLVNVPVRNEVTREAITEVLDELRRIRTGDVEEHELDHTKSYFIGVFPATVQTAGDIAGRLLDMEVYDLPEDYFDHYRENIAAVTRDDVTRVAQKYIDPDRAIIVVVGNAEQVRAPLAQLGYAVHELDVDGKEIA
ncbi:MAG TPA: pitrilysin family protein [Thermoanaerobaculia bacterium]|nr:pitrilysin family protein [Thermoanaerobaculia bacterium]